MNEAHERCGSDEWRTMMRDVILPWAMADVDLGDDVLEVGPGYGATTDVLCRSVARLTAAARAAALAALVTERFAGLVTLQTLHGDASPSDQPDGRFSGTVRLTM